MDTQMNSSESDNLSCDKPSLVLRKERAQRVKYLRKLTQMSRHKFAKHLSIPYGSLQSWEDTKYGGLTPSGAARVIQALEKEGIFCNITWLLQGSGPEPYISVSALLDRMKICKQNHQVNEISADEALKVEEELALFNYHYQNILHLVVPDHLMQPAFEKGDKVAGKAYTNSAISSLIGKTCIIELINGDKLLRILQKSKEADSNHHYQLTPLCYTESPPFIAAVKTAAPVQWMRRSFQDVFTA